MRRPKGTGSIYQRPDSGVFWMKYSRYGKAYRESTRTTDKTKAQKLLKIRLAEIITGQFVGPKAERIKVEELAEDFLRESVRDQSEDLQKKKLATELQAMSPEEIKNKAKHETEMVEETEDGPIALQAAAVLPLALAVEQALLARISYCLGFSHHVRTNQRLGNVEFDAMVRVGQKRQIIVEIKYIRKGFNRGWVSMSMANLSLRMTIYRKTFGEDVSGLLLVVIATSNSPLARKIATISSELQSASASLSNVRVRTIYKEDIASMACEDLKHLIVA